MSKIEDAKKLIDISIHALREEGDGIYNHIENSTAIFLSTPSARRATVDVFHAFCGLRISIHALREEGDRMSRTLYR